VEEFADRGCNCYCGKLGGCSEFLATYEGNMNFVSRKGILGFTWILEWSMNDKLCCIYLEIA